MTNSRYAFCYASVFNTHKCTLSCCYFVDKFREYIDMCLLLCKLGLLETRKVLRSTDFVCNLHDNPTVYQEISVGETFCKFLKIKIFVNTIIRPHLHCIVKYAANFTDGVFTKKATKMQNSQVFFHDNFLQY